MKTSDKLILISFLAALGLFGAVHLTLYARYSKGMIVTEKELKEEQFARYPGAEPQVLSLEGGLLVTIIPSESFSLEMEKRFSGGNKGGNWPKGRYNIRGTNDGLPLELNYQVRNDTLVITGILTRTINNPHNPWQSYSGFPRVNIYSGRLRNISVAGGMAILKGEKRPGLFHAGLSMENALLWIGESYDNNNDPQQEQSLDSVQVHAVNSMLVLHRNVRLQKFSASMDDRSEISDQQATIGHSAISYSAGSRINITGANLKNLHPSGP